MFKMIALPHLRLFRRFFTWSVAFVAIVSVSFWLIYVSVEQRLRLGRPYGQATAIPTTTILSKVLHRIFSKSDLKRVTTPRPVWYNESITPPVNTGRSSENELTIVTAFFDIGKFQKGQEGIRSSQLYRKWLTVFARINNPVVAYFDNATHADLMRVLRQKHPKTRIVVIDRQTLWTFREMEPRIAKIFSQKDYPRHPPKTVTSKFPAAVHSKYELMRRTIRDNPFHSAYFCWLDVGLFRGLANANVSSAVNDSRLFQLAVPPNLNSTAVGYAVVYPRSPNPNLTSEAIVRGNIDWVCGCFFIGRVDVLFRWTAEFLAAVERMVSEKWISSDQQVLTWLMLGEGKKKIQPKTSLQLYKPDGLSDPWFYLGYLAKKTGEQKGVSPRPTKSHA